MTASARASLLARARTDAADRLVSADEPLLGLQLRCVRLLLLKILLQLRSGPAI